LPAVAMLAVVVGILLVTVAVEAARQAEKGRA
jgi:hypothetical protein